MSLTFQEEANYRNDFVHYINKNVNIPSYALWTAEYIAKENIQQRIQWWNDLKKTKKINDGEQFKKIDLIIQKIRNISHTTDYIEKDTKRFSSILYCDI